MPQTFPSKLRLFWSLARPFWTSDEKWRALLLLGAVLTTTALQNWIGIRLSYWNRDFFNTVQHGDYSYFVHLGAVMIGLIFLSITFWLAEDYLFSSLKIRWRRWLTTRFLDQWLGDRAHYLGQLDSTHGDNPDQRISEDIRSFVFTSLDLFMQVFSAAIGFVSFVVILWGLSGGPPTPLDLPPPVGLSTDWSWLNPTYLALWHAYEVTMAFLTSIPGHLVWFCLLYSWLGTWLVSRVGQPIIGLAYEQEKLEADFRFGLIRLRENSESTALIEGEPAERRTLGASFSRIVGNFNARLVKQIHLNAFKAVYFRLSDSVPLLLSAPRFFAGIISLGQLTQLTGAFGRVQSCLNLFINSFETFASWWAVTQRLDGFVRGIEHARVLRASQSQIYDSGHTGDRLEVQNLALYRPDGRLLLAPVNFSLTPGDSVLITGPSGCGKSTLLRALAGIWPYEQGSVHLPAPFRCMVMPQKPYLPIGTLRAAVCYPEAPEKFSDEAVRTALALAQAPALAARLDEEAHWSQHLSGGEQQRVALSRLFLHRPEWIFLDEATSAMDEAAEQAFYLSLRATLPNVAYLTIAHRSTLKALHARHFRVLALDDGSHELAEINNAMANW
ncbi:MAG: ABC transporter ATP-binding protein/permease [Verrucomicrobia bacterium]|nr:ABC transporter ATP-binding protein/permease [Verrucomicrobiota bacterium]